jgi:hypothetical protein
MPAPCAMPKLPSRRVSGPQGDICLVGWFVGFSITCPQIAENIKRVEDTPSAFKKFCRRSEQESGWNHLTVMRANSNFHICPCFVEYAYIFSGSSSYDDAALIASVE